MNHRKWVPVEQLQVGMRMVDLDLSWMATPFLRHRMMLRDRRQIERIRACGARYAQIETDEAPADVEDTIATAMHTAGPIPAPMSSGASTVSPESAPYVEELPRANEVYSAARNILMEAVDDVRMGREVNVPAVMGIVENIVDSLVRNPDALPSLTRLKSHDEYTFSHSVNVGVLAVAFGRHHGLGSDAILRLGTGALLHDIGKVRIPLEILNKAGQYTRREYDIMKAHPEAGAEILHKTDGITEDAIHPALEHHERGDGSGYPFNKTLARMNRYGLITQVADVYDAMTSERVYHKQRPPYEVLRYLYARGQAGHFDFKTVQEFIQCVGIYPVGSLIQLDTGETAIVMTVNRNWLLAPRILIIQDQNGPLSAPYPEVDLAETSLQPHRAITGVLDHSSLAINLADYLAKPQDRPVE